MVNSTFNFLANTFNFAFQSRNACVEFINGKRVDILLQQQGQRIIRALGQKIIGIHRVKVDPSVALVNMAESKAGAWLWIYQTR
jgi:hypothetical protein